MKHVLSEIQRLYALHKGIAKYAYAHKASQYPPFEYWDYYTKTHKSLVDEWNNTKWWWLPRKKHITKETT